VRVDEPSGAGGAVVETSYAYDLGDRLTSVTSNAGSQARGFSYDRRGFLLSETHPKKSAPVTYADYDARGNARRKVDGASNLTFRLDTAGRLDRVSETGGRVLKEFFYGTGNADRSNGKLVTARRHNYIGASNALLTTGLAYGGRGGRVSSRTLQLAFNGTRVFTVSSISARFVIPLGPEEECR
jgi:YD repeat-containing protein